MVAEGVGFSTMMRKERQKRLNLQKLDWVPTPVTVTQKQGGEVSSLSDPDDRPGLPDGTGCCEGCFQSYLQGNTKVGAGLSLLLECFGLFGFRQLVTSLTLRMEAVFLFSSEMLVSEGCWGL